MPGNLPPFDVPASIGIPKGTMESVIVLPPDLDALERTLATRQDIAGVITEGSGASYGTVPLKPGFVEGVRGLTQQYGVVMILDEVITGFRWSPGGLQQKLGIVPDLCTLAKVLTGGLPGGAVAGRDDFMQVMTQTGDSHRDRFQRVSHGGTFNANPYCAATGNAALKIAATGEMQEMADRMAERLRGGLREILDRREVAACVYGQSSTFHVYFGGRSIQGLDATALKNVPSEIQNGFRRALQVRGVDLMSRCSGVLSGVHTEADIDESLEAFDGAIEAMMDEGLVSYS
jgi:glutamate-1-semialdehyde 2,1-aminomutase